MEEDYAIRAIASAGLPGPGEQFVPRKFSPFTANMSADFLFCEDAEGWPRTGAIESNSSPQLLQPAEFWCAGGGAAKNDEVLKASWLAEVEEMRTRILAIEPGRY